MSDNTPAQFNQTKLSFSLDFRIIIFLLLAIIAGMLIVWKPWVGSPGSADQIIKVTGEANVKAEPDQFVFYPTYEFKNANKESALSELTKKSDELVAKLKSLGVAESKIKTNSSGYENYGYYRNEDNTHTYNLQLTVNVDSKDMAQKVQDYLVSTTPTGSVSPQPTFSDSKRKELESKARDEATKDARGKADQSAKNLGFKVSKVKAVEDGAGFDQIYPLAAGAEMDSKSLSSRPQLAVQPGENELNYSVTVTYFIR